MNEHLPRLENTSNSPPASVLGGDEATFRAQPRGTWSMSATLRRVCLIYISFLVGKMSLFNCGFRRISRSENSETDQQSIVTPPKIVEWAD